MKFICDKETLYNGISIVSKAISSRTTLKALEGIYIETQNDKIRLACTDLTIGIETLIEANVIEEGRALVPGRIFNEFTKKLPSGNITLDFEENQVRIDYGYSSTNLQILNADEFPTLPEVVEDKSILIKESKLRHMITSTLFSVAIEESRPVLTGALFEVKENVAKFVCLDGYRLALSKIKLGDDYDDVAVIIPGSTLSEVQKLLNGDETIKIHINDSHIQFLINDTKIISRLIEGEFIKYENIIPNDWESRILVNVDELSNSIDRASTLSREDGNNVIKMDIVENKLKVSTESILGNILEDVNIELDGKNISIAFNVKYIADVLKHIDSDIKKVYFSFMSSSNPCIITGVDNDDFTYLVLPIRIY